MVQESEKAQETVEKPSIPKNVAKKKIIRKQIDVEQSEDPVPKKKKGLKRNVRIEAELLDGAIVSRRKARSCTADKIPEKKKSTERISEKGSVERVSKRKNSNAEIVDEPVKEVQKPKPVNINKKTKVAEKLKKKSQREVVSDESEPVKKKAKAEKPTEGKKGKVVKKTLVPRKK